MKQCKRKCDIDTDNPDPLTRYTQKTPTPSGWYITVIDQAIGQWGTIYGIKNISIGFEITNENKLYENYLDMLEELPDPTKTYTTGRWPSKKKWKLKYNTDNSSLEWENQQDHTTKPFVINSPLNIGDQMAKQSE